MGGTRSDNREGLDLEAPLTPDHGLKATVAQAVFVGRAGVEIEAGGISLFSGAKAV